MKPYGVRAFGRHYPRRRDIIIAKEDGERSNRNIGDGIKPHKSAVVSLTLDSGDDTIVRLVSFAPKRERLEYGSDKQTLQQHVRAVAAEFAADYHDHGKNRKGWQRTIDGEADRQ